MGFTFIASSAAYNTGGATTIDTDETFDIVAGDLLVAIGSDVTADTTIAIADEDGGNSFTMLTKRTLTATYSAVGYKIAATEATGKVIRVTYGVSAEFRNVVVMQFRPDGGDTVSFEEGDNPATGFSTNPTSNAITTTGTDDLVIGVSTMRYGKAYSSPEIDGGAADGSKWEEAGNSYLALWYKLYTGAQIGIVADITEAVGAADWSCDFLYFKSVAAVGGIVVLRRRRM